MHVQYCLLVDSPAQVSLHLEVEEEAANVSRLCMSLECYHAESGAGVWEVVFARPCTRRLVGGKNMMSAVLEIESAGAYIIVPTFSRTKSEAAAVDFHMAIAAATEIEVQPMSLLQVCYSNPQPTPEGPYMAVSNAPCRDDVIADAWLWTMLLSSLTPSDARRAGTRL